MQRLPSDMLHVGVVQVISNKRVAQMLHVDAYLMGPAGLQVKRDEAVPVFFFYDTVMSDGRLSLLPVDGALDNRTGLA